jgi:hypothetical protein
VVSRSVFKKLIHEESNDIKYKPDITAWATIRKLDTWAISDTIDKNVMLFIPDSDKEYDNVYLTTSDNLSFKMGFAVKEQNQRLDKIIKEYSKPIDLKAEIRNMDYISYE